MWQFFKFGIVCLLACVFLFVPSPNEAESHVLPTATRTRTASLTQTSTRSLTSTITVTQTQTPTASSTVTNSPTVTESATSTETPTATITPSPTATSSPTPTPVQKTEIKVFDNVSLIPGFRVSSQKIDVRNYSKLSIFLSSINGDINTAVCYFVPDSGNVNDRYQLTTISVATGTQSGYNQAVKNGEIIGPNIVCEVSNYRYGTTVSMSLYLIP